MCLILIQLVLFLTINTIFVNCNRFHDEEVVKWDESAPLIPATLPPPVQAPPSGKLIPRNVWIAVRNSSETPARHMLGPTGFLQRNSRWKVSFCGNEEKDAFMHHHFAASKFLWSYYILNPMVGTSKSELWRLAVLYVHGGMYMDDDANIGVPLDDVVKPTDQFVVGKESYNWTDTCYRDEFPLSNHSLSVKFGALNQLEFFDNRFFFNWAMFVQPRHPLLLRIIEHVVQLIRFEYVGRTMIKMSPADARGKLLMCASTFPINLAARELLLEVLQKSNLQSVTEAQRAIGFRVGTEQFREYDADMKAWNNDHRSDRWFKVLKKQPYLRDYGVPDEKVLEGRLVQPQGKASIYLIEKGVKRQFGSFDRFLDLGYKLDLVQSVPMQVLKNIPQGADV